MIPAPAAILVAIGGAMLCIALYGLVAGEMDAASAFAISGALALGGAAAIACGFRESALLPPLRSEIMLLLAFWIALPALASLPVVWLLPEIGFRGAWFEMVSGFTTTGATVIADLDSQPRSLLLWRSVSQWLGGFATLVAVLSILAPRALGSFGSETALDIEGRSIQRGGRVVQMPIRHRLARATARAAPLYAAATVILFFGYVAGGMTAFDAVNHAMTTVSTGGFSTRDGGLATWASLPVECVAAIGMLLGATSAGVFSHALRRHWSRLRRDRELWMLTLVLAAATLSPLLVGAVEAFSLGEFLVLGDAAQTLWANFFRAVSFLTTTGFESSQSGAAWGIAEPSPVILLGLAAVGGGVASTAGGIRLRVVALLFLHSVSEVAKIGRPRVVLTARRSAHTQEEVRTAWLVAMLFAVTASSGMLVCTLSRMPFDVGMVAAISSLSNAGPLLPAVSGEPRIWATMPALSQVACCLLMAFGRIGLLALLSVAGNRWD